MATKTYRKPSPAVLAKSLWRAAFKAEQLAARLQELDQGDAARGVESAARELSYAATRMEDRTATNLQAQ